PVLEPEVKQVARDEQLRRLAADVLEEGDEPALRLGRNGAQVDVRHDVIGPRHGARRYPAPRAHHKADAPWHPPGPGCIVLAESPRPSGRTWRLYSDSGRRPGLPPACGPRTKGATKACRSTWVACATYV